MAAPSALSAIPYNQTDAYQDQFRVQNTDRHSCHFFGIVPPKKSLDLSTGDLGYSMTSSSVKARLIASGPPPFAMQSPHGAKTLDPNGMAKAVLWFKRLNTLKTAVDVARAPMDSFLGMTIRDAATSKLLIYTNAIDHQWDVNPGFHPFPLTASIRLTNNNPVNPVWFAFGLYFLTDETS